MKGKSYQLFGEMINTIDCIGVDNTIKALKLAQKNLKDNRKNLQDFIIDICCQKYSISKKQLIDPKESYNNKNIIVAVVAFLLVKNCQISQVSVSLLLNRDNTVISKKIKHISQLDAVGKKNDELINEIKQLQELINDFKNKIIDNE